MRTDSPPVLGKYRDLVIAIALFLLLDLGVLVFNFLASQELERDATRINRAGELRMLTQQITKALLTFQIERAGGLPTQTSAAQLSEGHGQFVKALDFLKAEEFADRGGFARLFDTGDARDAVEGLVREWVPLDEAIRPVLAAAQPAAFDIENAASKAVARNIKMANQADDLALAVEKSALGKAARMRQIQVAGITLALVNFVFIVFKFLRRLRESDRVAESARQDTTDILDNVGEGLLLVRRDGRVGSQYSRSLATMLGRAPEPGEDFRALMGSIVDPSLQEPLSDYLDLLFKPDVKPALVAGLNPLQQAPVRPAGGGPARHLDFRFLPIVEGGRVEELLVTVVDVTAQVSLERELAGTRERARSEMEDLLAVLDKDVAAIDAFLDAAALKIGNLNESLQAVRPSADAYGALVQVLLTTMHGIKGEAAALDLASVAARAHAFEEAVSPLRGRTGLAGDDFIPVAVELAEVLRAVDRLQRIVSRVRRFGRTEALANPVDALVAPLAHLASRVASDLGRQVRFEPAVPHLSPVPEPLALVLREALPQLVRNAIAHGIEPPEERRRAGKDPVGTLRLEVTPLPGGNFTVSLRDDGRGLHVEEIRTRLVEKGLHGADEAAALSHTQVLSAIFDPRFTTVDRAHEHAGRGVGLALVRELVAKAGARLRVASTPRLYTQFIVQL